MKGYALLFAILFCNVFYAQKKSEPYAIISSPIYAGWSSDIQIYIGKADSVSASGSVLTKENGKYKFYVNDHQISGTITFWKKGNPIKEQVFFIAEPPQPVISYNGVRNGKMNVAMVKAGLGINAYIPHGACSISCLVTYYTVTRIGTDCSKSTAECTSLAFSAEAKELMLKAQPGDIYLFQNIKLKTTIEFHQTYSLIIEVK